MDVQNDIFYFKVPFRLLPEIQKRLVKTIDKIGNSTGNVSVIILVIDHRRHARQSTYITIGNSIGNVSVIILVIDHRRHARQSAYITWRT